MHSNYTPKTPKGLPSFTQQPQLFNAAAYQPYFFHHQRYFSTDNQSKITPEATTTTTTPPQSTTPQQPPPTETPPPTTSTSTSPTDSTIPKQKKSKRIDYSKIPLSQRYRVYLRDIENQYQQEEKLRLTPPREKLPPGVQRPHDCVTMFGRETWEKLIIETSARLNQYLEITQYNDRKASGLDNNRLIWANQRIAPAILHDKYRYINRLDPVEKSEHLINLWLSGAEFKAKVIPATQPVRAWLSLLIIMVMAMVSAGGVTRLTRSGLSMTTWKFTGEKKPITDEDWNDEFNLYKQSPEWRLHNQEMTLDQFKFIYHMEYGHRSLGRVIGMAFVLPFLTFLLTGSVSLKSSFGKGLLGCLTLGGIQGLIGWWMVKSGLDEKTNVEKAKVSPYRLATHLTIAFTLLIGLTTLKMRATHGVIETYVRGDLIPKSTNLFGFAMPHKIAHGLAITAFLTAITGAFVAGNDAGLVYNEWPQMGTGLIPGDLYDPHLGPLRNCFENPTFVQFVHRNMAYTTFTLSWVAAIKAVMNKATPGPVANAAMRTATLTTMQAMLGIYTLLNHVPTETAALHQAGAMLVLMSSTQYLFLSKNQFACLPNLAEQVQRKQLHLENIGFAQDLHKVKVETFHDSFDKLSEEQRARAAALLAKEKELILKVTKGGKVGKASAGLMGLVGVSLTTLPYFNQNNNNNDQNQLFFMNNNNNFQPKKFFKD